MHLCFAECQLTENLRNACDQEGERCYFYVSRGLKDGFQEATRLASGKNQADVLAYRFEERKRTLGCDSERSSFRGGGVGGKCRNYKGREKVRERRPSLFLKVDRRGGKRPGSTFIGGGGAGRSAR